MSKPQAMQLLYQNSQHTRVMDLKYKYKCKRMKRQIKAFLFENGAICDELAHIQSELAIGREERRYLLKRLMRHEGLDSIEQQRQHQQQQQERKQKQQQLKAITSTQQQAAKKVPHLPKKRGPKKRPQNEHSDKYEKSRCKPRDRVILDENGKPIFPINLYSILIHSPGEIIPVNPNFHTPCWIYPVGYVATRIYAHPKDPTRKCVFTCKILNNAGMPQFQIIPDNDLDSVFFGESANVCHQGLLEALQRSLSDVVKLPMHVKGEQFFGLANATVKSLLQMDASFTLCANFKGFVEPDDNFKVSEDKDATMNFEALQYLISISAYHTMPEVKEEPPDELLEVN